MLPEILKLLQTENFCFLATSYQDLPHLSLMNFTYLTEENLIILSSRADTTKVRYMKKNPETALLLCHLEGNEQPAVSCTLYGTATVLQADKDLYYREIHYKNNKDMGKFIRGDNISIIMFQIKHAAISNLDDRVYSWTANSNTTSNPE